MSLSHRRFRNPGSEDIRNEMSAWPVPARGGEPGADVQAALNVRDSEQADDAAWGAFAASTVVPGVSDRLAPAEPWTGELAERVPPRELQELALGDIAVRHPGEMPVPIQGVHQPRR